MSRSSTPLILGALVAAVLVVYTPAWQFDFIRGDDGSYVNARVLEGLTPSNLSWALSSFESSNWHPLTWWSLMLDADLGGGGPAMFHLTNLLLHLLNTALLFAVLQAMTGRRARSFVVALLFAVHPLRVESVAWVAERKDVLSAAFWMLTLLAYLRYSRRPSPGRGVLTAALFALGLMAKPMLVTLPLVLVLLDFWPLERLRDVRSALSGKLALLVLTVGSCAVTLHAQSAGGAVATLEKFPLGLRVANATVSYARYIGKTLWPVDLAPQYPYDVDPSPWLVGACALLLAGLSWGAFRYRASRPYLLVGWLWFLGTLVPVIGLVQVGNQAMADRYSYIPSIGLLVAVVWGAADLARGRPRLLAVSTAIVVVALIATARIQAGYWRNSLALFTHAVEVAPGNVMAHVNLGVELQESGRTEAAIEHYREALRADPAAIEARANLAAALALSGRTEESVAEYREALRRAPGDHDLHTNLGIVLSRLGRWEQAEAELRRAIELDPARPVAWKSLGIAVFRQGRLDEAIDCFSRALQLDPTREEVRRDLENLRRLAD